MSSDTIFVPPKSPWELVRWQGPAPPLPVHVTAYPQRSKSVVGLMRSSAMEMESSRAVRGDNMIEASEPCQRPRSATGFAQHTGQNMW
ncbi:hypothetical protein MY8738_005952 [Beauveria namnaoensis]